MKNRFHAADVVCLVALLILQTGCATITRGKTQELEITSEPSGARVRILPDDISRSTPCEVDLSRTLVRTVVVEKEGYTPARVYVDRYYDGWGFMLPYLGNFILGGVIGMMVDLSNMEEIVLALDPRELHVTLEPLTEDKGASEPP